MSASIGTAAKSHVAGGDRVREEPIMRFSVKCTREQNQYLIELAGKVGMTPNELVQSAMNTLLADYKPAGSARRLGVGWTESVSAEMVARVLKALTDRMDVRGKVTFTVAEICREIGISGNTFYSSTRVLSAEGRIERLQCGGNGIPAVFQVKRAFELAQSHPP